jgi:hypothetical protein
METPLYEGTADVPAEEPFDPTSEPPTIIIRLHRLRAVVDCLRDSLELIGNEYSPHIEGRTLVCDLIAGEIGVIVIELGEV